MKTYSRYKTKTIVLWSVILTGLVFLTTVLTSEMSYLTNDDGGIQSALSGFTTGEPYPYHQFISVILSFPIAGLYKILPGVQWWYVWSLVAMAVGIFLVQYCFLRVAVNGKHSLIVVFCILIFLDIGFFIYPIANVSFTIVPAILGTGLIAGLFWLAEKETIKHKRWIFFGIVIGYILLLSHRRLTGLAVLCYLLLAFLYYYVNKSEDLKKAALKFIGTAGMFLLITAALTTFNSTLQNNHNGEDFVAFNSARSQFMDYPHDSYTENPELYEEVGWDEDIYKLVTQWCFLNDKVTAENLSYVSENSTHTTASTNVTTLLDQIFNNKQCQSIFLLYAASIVIAMIILICCFDPKTLIFLLLNNVGTAMLILYQILGGRAMYRSIVIVLLPAVVINLLLSLRKEIKGRPVMIINISLLLLGIVCIVPMMSATFDQDRKAYVVETKDKHHIIDSFLADHPSNFYVREALYVTDNIDPENIRDRSSNCMGWGGSNKYSAIYYEQLKNNGLTELTEETFKAESVYFISKTNAIDESYHDDGNDPFAMFYRKLQEDCNAIGFVMEDTITDGVYVYHFVFDDENEMGYNSYYDIVNGNAVEIYQ